MCYILLAINQAREYPFILAANRDEFYQRESSQLAFWDDKPQIAGGRVDLAALLLEFGADVDEEKWGITCLHKAARQGHRDLATHLLAHGADVNAFGRSDFSDLFGTPLDWALSNGQQEVAGLLRDAGGRQGRDRALPGQTGRG